MATNPSTQKTPARSPVLSATPEPLANTTLNAPHTELLDNTTGSLAGALDVMAMRMLQLQDWVTQLYSELDPVLAPRPDTAYADAAAYSEGGAPMVERLTSLCDQLSYQIWRLHQLSSSLAVTSSPKL